jgi:glycosyltransferase involved in cell wall biosynthesis
VSKPLRVAWLAPFPVEDFAAHWKLSRRRTSYHPCSWILNLSRAMAKRPDIELHLVTLNAQFPETQVVKVNGITYHGVRDAVPFTRRGYPFWFPVPLWTGFSTSTSLLLKQLDTVRPDIVHAHGTEAAYGPAGVKSGRPCLISIQGVVTEYFKTDPSWTNRLLQRSEQACVRRCHFFTCRTHFDSNFVRRENPRARIFMIHEAMDPAFFAGQWEVRDDENILFVGSSERRKGLRILLEALVRVVQRRPQARLTIVGRVAPETQSLLRSEFEPQGLREKLDFAGFKRAAEIAKLHREAQIFVLPSENENSPNSLAEAMVSGMPVVAFDVGGVSSMVEQNQTGLLVPARDSDGLANALIDLLSKPAERARLGENARVAARQRHHPDAVAEHTAAAYREVLASQGN